jgi:hypothetical protein
MFMLVTYPWPVTSAHVELTGIQTMDDLATRPADSVDLRERHLEAMVGWTEGERLRFQWYGFRLAIRGIRRSKRKAPAGSPVSDDSAKREIRG